MDKMRRNLVFMAGLMSTTGVAMAKTLTSTPRQSTGPFYPQVLPLDNDNDLTRVEGRDERAKGIISDVSGQIVDINGHPLKNLRIEIWQCDANGRYHHPGDRSTRALDDNFQGHGHTLTNDQGEYRFRTIRPVPYPGRTPHIHVAVFSGQQRAFVTQLYIENEYRNDNDFLFNRIPRHKRHLVMADFKPATASSAEQEARFDIILNRRDGTPVHE